MRIRLGGCRANFRVGDVVATVAYVLGDRRRKQNGLLTHHAYVLSQPANVQPANVVTVKKYLRSLIRIGPSREKSHAYLAARQIKESLNELNKCTLSRATWTHESHGASTVDAQTNIVKNLNKTIGSRFRGRRSIKRFTLTSGRAGYEKSTFRNSIFPFSVSSLGFSPSSERGSIDDC